MIAEELTREYLISANLSVGSNVFCRVPVNPPTEYILIEKIGGNLDNHIRMSRLDIQSRSDISLQRAMDINEEVKDAMEVFPDESTGIFAAHLTYDNNFTNPASKQFRYQVGYAIYH